MILKDGGQASSACPRPPLQKRVITQTPEPAESTSLILKQLKEETATHILKVLREQPQYPWCRKMLARLRLPPTVHDETGSADPAFGSAACPRYIKKKPRTSTAGPRHPLEKLDYMHNNPVQRGLVSLPGDWAWSSWRFYFLQDTSVLTMDRGG